MPDSFRIETEVPILETKRLLLRGHRLDDFVHCVSMWADPEVTRYIGGKPLTEEEAWTKFLRYAGHWKLLGFGYWVVEEKATASYVGEIGFADYKRDLNPPLGSVPEIGWALASRVHGKGYATEAILAAVAWGDLHFKRATACIIEPQNIPSIKVADKCGYREKHQATYRGKSVTLFAREWNGIANE